MMDTKTPEGWGSINFAEPVETTTPEPTPDHAVSTVPDGHDFGASVPTAPALAVDSTSDAVKWSAKFQVSSVAALLVLVYQAATAVGPPGRETAVPIIIAVLSALVVWATPRASAGLLAYTKLGAQLAGAAAQVLVPVLWTHEWSWGLAPVVVTQLFGAFYLWQTPDGKSPMTALHRTVKEGKTAKAA